jgi:tRNA pseudouridine55 synthase
MFGFLNIDKPPGPTSHDVVAMVRRLLPRSLKVGHAGTLDPFASGVLVVCIGHATRLADMVQRQSKRYVAQILLGAASSTDDSQGKIVASVAASGVLPPSSDQVRQALSAMVGQVQQVPPQHSAVHVAGQRAYHLARRGQEMALPARPVTIYSIDLVRYDYPQVEIEVHCGSGTYIRSIARDLGAALGVGGYCRQLRRTQVGLFKVQEAANPEHLDIPTQLIPPLGALADIPIVKVDPTGAARIARGQCVALDHAAIASIANPTVLAPNSEAAITDQEGNLLAIAVVDPDAKTLRPTKVFQAQ